MLTDGNTAHLSARVGVDGFYMTPYREREGSTLCYWREQMKTWMLRTCKSDRSAYGGFVWPESGPVVAPDWRAAATCGNGLHGLLMGVGDGSMLSWEPTALWLVVEIDAESVVDLSGKVKVPAGDVVYCGSREGAVELLVSKGAEGPKMVGGLSSATGDSGSASATGSRGSASATGYSGSASATGDSGSASATGYSGSASATGDSGSASATGSRGSASATGDSGSASATGAHGIALGSRMVASGSVGAVVLRYWSGTDNRYRYRVGYVGEDIEAYHWYDLDAAGAWRKLEPVADDLLPPDVREARKVAREDVK